MVVFYACEQRKTKSAASNTLPTCCFCRVRAKTLREFAKSAPPVSC
jgi:hypothetical protein